MQQWERRAVRSPPTTSCGVIDSWFPVEKGECIFLKGIVSGRSTMHEWRAQHSCICEQHKLSALLRQWEWVWRPTPLIPELGGQKQGNSHELATQRVWSTRRVPSEPELFQKIKRTQNWEGDEDGMDSEGDGRGIENEYSQSALCAWMKFSNN